MYTCELKTRLGNIIWRHGELPAESAFTQK